MIARPEGFARTSPADCMCLVRERDLTGAAPVIGPVDQRGAHTNRVAPLPRVPQTSMRKRERRRVNRIIPGR